MEGKFICSEVDCGEAVVQFQKKFTLKKEVRSATVRLSAIGVYQAELNGRKIGEDVLKPGFTSYHNRVLYQTYSVKNLLAGENLLTVSVGQGWAVGHMGFSRGCKCYADQVGAFACLTVVYTDGSKETVATDPSWDVYTHEVTFSDIYHGETVDKTHCQTCLGKAILHPTPFPLVKDPGEKICEQEVLSPAKLIVTPKGERVLDFGQNLTGYVSLNIKADRGDRIVLSFGEVLDKDGNFYNENYRTAKNCITYICSGGEDAFKPRFSFQGFRYVRLEEYPFETVDLNGFRAIVVHSDIRRTGYFDCGHPKINQLYHNIIWGQKSNYLDLPTDCPQRDERLGWTGDAQVFCRTAAINYDVRKFFKKWLGDLRLEQGEDGSVRGVCPEAPKFSRGGTRISAGWGDVATVAPWTLYELYGDKTFLSDNFELMRGWVDYMHKTGPEEFLWLTGRHYGDWLAMDAGEDSLAGATANDLIASAFFAYSTKLLIQAGEVLEKDMSDYRNLYDNILSRFRSYFMENGMPKEEFPLTEADVGGGHSETDGVRKGVTQTAITLILYFRLCREEERAGLAEKLEELIHGFGDRMVTGFLGTPYILHTLTECGKNDLAYNLFFNETVPSWLYSVNHGATTMWEHWNGIKEDGSFWSKSMNSFNHYAYGAVGDWMYEVIAGIKVTEAGYKKVLLNPHPDRRLGFVNCRVETVLGSLESNWYYRDDGIHYEFTVPEGTEAELLLPDGYRKTLPAGRHCFLQPLA